MTIKNGDLPATPITPRVDYMHIKDKPYCNGLTKREQFAAMAMQGFCSNMEWTYEACPDGIVVSEWIAKQSLAAADALLAKLEQNK